MSLTREAGARQMFSVDLIGAGHATTQYLADPKHPALSATQLMKSTKWTQPRVTNSAAGNQDATDQVRNMDRRLCRSRDRVAHWTPCT